MKTLVFLCNNRRRTGVSCGQRCDTGRLADRLAQQVKRVIPDRQVEIVRTKCLGHCSEGPVLTILPDNVWYRYHDESDLDDVVSEHLSAGRPVARLLLAAECDREVEASVAR